MSDNLNFDYKNLTPFKWFILENFPFIEDSIDTLTNYQLFCKLGEEINKNRDSINLIGENAETLTNAFNALHDYVENYFDNLDVQEEINNKLDALVSNGTLTTLIGNYVQPQIDAQTQLITNRLNNQDTTLNSTLNNQNVRIEQIENKVDSVSSGSPLVASSTSGMTDTTRIYVNTTDGKWYYYDGDSWEIGGTYQSTSFGDDNIISDNIRNVEFDKVKSSILGINNTNIAKWNTSASGTLTTNADGSVTYNKTATGDSGVQIKVMKTEADQEDLLLVFNVVSYTGKIMPNLFIEYPSILYQHRIKIGMNYVFIPAEKNVGSGTIRQTFIIGWNEVSYLTLDDVAVYKGHQITNFYTKDNGEILNNYLTKQEYKNFNDYHIEEFDTGNMYQTWNTPTDFIIEDNVLKFGTNKNCGIRFKYRYDVSGILNIDFDLKLENGNATCYIVDPNVAIFYWSKSLTNGHNKISVDLGYLEIYKNLAAPYEIIIAGQSTSLIEVSNLKIFVSDIFNNELYDPNLEKMIFNIFNKISTNAPVSNVVLKSPNGTNYEVKVDNNGDLYTVGTTINKALFIGNSLLVGFGTHGMASYSVDDDYYAYINSYLLNKNENYTASKISGVTVETATSTTTARNYVDNSIIPLMDSSTNLVIIQLGDNTANNSTAVSLYKQNISYLVDELRDINPDVKILLVGCWYNASTMIPIMNETADENGITLVNISALNTSINQNHIGATYIDSQGQTQTITSEGVASHPSSTGMAAIASLIEQYI